MSIPQNTLLVKNTNFNNEDQFIAYEDRITIVNVKKNKVLKDLTNYSQLSKISQNKSISLIYQTQHRSNIQQTNSQNLNIQNKQSKKSIHQQIIKQKKIKNSNILLQFSQSQSNNSNDSQNKQANNQELKHQQKQNTIKQTKNTLINKNKKITLDFDELSDQQNFQQLLNCKQNLDIKKSKIQEQKKKNIILYSFNDSQDSSIDEDQPNQKKNQQMQVIKLLNIRKFETQSFDYLNNQIPQNKIFQCLVKRQKTSSHCEYHLYDSTAFKHILSVKEGNNGLELYRKCFGKQINEVISVLQYNFFGTQFKAFKGIDRKSQQVAISYETNILGLKGPRKMSIYLPFGKQFGEQSLENQYNKMNNKNIRKFINKPPKWNKQIGAYVLNFKGRATHSSVKNFLIVDQGNNNNKTYILFGKTGKQVFNLDILYPFTIIQGISIAISSFQKKIGCE